MPALSEKVISRSLMPPEPPASMPVDPVVSKARTLLEEDRGADAADLLEHHPSPAADRLHLEIATRAGTTALRTNERATAIAWFDRGLARNPADPTLNFFRGNLHLDAGHVAAAVACFRRCVAADPGRVEFVCNLGHALLAAGDPAGAAECVAALPDSPQAQLNLGAALEKLGAVARAAEAYERAGRLQPDLFEAWYNLSSVRGQLGDSAGALVAANRAVALRPTSVASHRDRGFVLARLKRHPEAAQSFERALRLDPGCLESRLALADIRQHLCDWRDVQSYRDSLVVPLLGALESARRFDPFSVLALPGCASPEELRRIAARRAGRLGRHLRALRPDAAVGAGRPLRIGYVSPDLGNHAVGHCVRGLFARHDRTRVTVHAFALRTRSADACQAAIRAGCDTWDELEDLDDQTAADCIAHRGIDVLVDLAGHTRDNRLGLFSARPAPIQVAWLGYPGTTGASYVGHLLCDPIVAPPSSADAYSEQLVHLPGCYLPTDDTQPVAAGGDRRADHGLPDTGFVFCAFNNAFKIEPTVFGAWMEILRRVERSVLWLRGGAPELEANLRREAAARGVDPARLVFENRGLPKDRHLARHRAADLYLDTHFYNAHTTAADALWAGLPVLTCPGASFPARVGLSLLSALGLAAELAAGSLEDYVERAVQLAREPDRLLSLRERLVAARLAPGGLFDTTAFARKLEDAYAALAAGRR